ncbi:MAG TPA: methylmalonyl-CoA mutase family protein, partial [Candidatus Acidoferrales bacterium]|nr:methylmalonyl-CoA mutase family protein [Candidatus Acidoferrales bacterium]
MPQKAKNYWRTKAENLSQQRTKSGTLFDSKARRKVQLLQRKWVRSTVRPWVGKSPERKDSFEDPSGISLRTVYTPLDIAHHQYEKEAGLPGEFPYTRGIYPTMYWGRFWTMRMFSGYGTPEETNSRLKYLLKEGETGLSIAFDMPTLYGVDADHPRSEGEVGKCGVSVSSLRDMEV